MDCGILSNGSLNQSTVVTMSEKLHCETTPAAIPNDNGSWLTF